MLQIILTSVGQALGLIVLCTIVELIVPKGKIRFRERVRGTAFALSLPILSVLSVMPIQSAMTAVGVQTVAVIPLASWLSPLGLTGEILFLLILVVLSDFLGYWGHRFEHRFWWPVHAVHHSPTELCGAISYGHFLQIIPTTIFLTLPLTLIQFSGPAQPVMLALALSFHALFIHAATEINYGPLSAIFVDNRYHRIHHSAEPHHFDKNFAVVFKIWDQIFGTIVEPKPGEWPKTGIDQPPPTSFAEYLLFPFRWFRPRRSPETASLHGKR